MMRPILRGTLTLATMFAAAACTVAPAKHTPADEAVLRARSDSLSAAEAALDQTRSLAFWAPDAIIQPAGMAQIQGTAQIAGLYKQFFEGMGLKALVGKSSSITMSDAGDMAYEVGVNHMTFGSPKGDMMDVGKYIIVWKKTNGTWYVAALSFTSDAAAPVPVAGK
jgi:ketosteroid isomerase-like protein